MKITKAKLLNPIWKIWYSYISGLDKKGEVTFLNYGYAYDKDIELEKEDEINRYSAQLYHHVVGSVVLKGLDVLEVGCGRGGTSYIIRYFEPKSLKGLDLCAKSIEFCEKNYSIKGLSFVQGNALNLPFSNDSFDAVANVESSHRYPDMKRFLDEVCRVLKSGGYFLFADLRDAKSTKILKEYVNKSKLKIVKEEDITPCVIKALDLDHKRRMDLINRLAPKFLHPLTKEFAGTKETGLYKSFVSGDKKYLHYVLQKD